MNILKRLSDKNADARAGAHVTLAFFGDSVTHGGFELIELDGKFEGVCDYEAVYHNQLKKMLHVMFPNTPINIINAGIGGDSATGSVDRVERDVLCHNPDLCVVCFGLNDSGGGMDGLERYLSSLRSIFASLRERDVEIIFLTPNMMNTYVSPLCGPVTAPIANAVMAVQNGGIMDAYMDGARSLCRELGIPVCDCYARWKALHAAGVDTTKLLSNRINHPTREMHTLFASMLFDMIMFGE